MKIAIPVFILLSIALIIFNFFQLDFQNLFQGDSLVAIACILAGGCVILLMLILRTSRKIAGKQK